MEGTNASLWKWRNVIGAHVIKRIELVNFMSHQRTVIEPADGLTVLVGPNNCGKSAFVSALQILCHNAKSNYVLRHGEKKCEIIVQTDDDHLIQWSRTRSGSPKYVIDDQEFDRLKGGVPDELHEILSLAKVTCEKDQFDVHFGEQKSPVFLLNDSGKASAQFFASSSDAIRLVEMQDRHKGKLRDAKRDWSRLSTEQNRMTDALKQLSPVEEISERLADCERDYLGIRQSDDVIEQAAIVIRALEEVQRLLAKRDATAVCLSKLPTPPNLFDTQSLERLILSLQQSDALYRRTSETLDALSDLSSPPQISDPVPLIGSLETRATMETQCEQLGAMSQALEQLESPPETEDESGLQAISEKINLAARQFSIQTARAAVLGKLPQIPKQSDETMFESMLKEITQSEKSVARSAGELEQLGGQLDSLTQQMKDWVADNPDCPTCGAKTTVVRLIGSRGQPHG